MNTITIELCAEDRARLDNILEALKGVRTNCDACVKAAVAYTATAIAEGKTEDAPKVAPQPEEPTEEPTAPAEATPTETPTEEPVPAETPAEEPTAPTVSRAEVQQKVVRLAATPKKAQVREIVNQYAPKVSDIPEDKLAEVLDKLTALEVQA